MCSVVGCGSWRRSAQRFKLPEDPERRLEWVQFVFEVNGQRLKESSWTDITICSEHFTGDSFENPAPPGTVQLKPGAVPSVCIKSEPDEPLESPQYVEPVETTEASCQCDDLEACNRPTPCSEESEDALTDAVTTGYGQNEPNVIDADANQEKAALLQMEGKYIVNESCLLQLFRRKCPSCGCGLQMEKVTCGVLIVLNQRCLQCQYRDQWKSQINASVPAAEEVAPEAQAAVPTADDPSGAVSSELVAFSDDDSDPSDEGEEGDDGGASSDGEWNPAEDFSLAEALAKESEEETEDEGEEEEEEELDSPGGLKINELCTECGSFFNVLKPHACEHKVKPYSCNICGKRCVTETSLRTHGKIHDETYEHPCKYCHVTFKTRADKLRHEQAHQDGGDPYRCPDCPATFATGKERGVHLSTNHRAPREFKCGVCGIEFKDVHHLRRHSVVHTGLRPYKCSVCQRGFNQTSHLKSHMRLHTGERPYACRHCDRRFNHNVSLKSHVRRCHASGPGRGRKRGEAGGEARGGGGGGGEDERGADSELDDAEGERGAEEEAQKQRRGLPKSRKRSTGRPRGRPKRNAEGDSVMPGRKKGRRSSAKTSKSKKLKRAGSSDEGSEGEHSDGNASSGSEAEEEEEEEGKRAARKSKGRSLRKRPKNDSDSDFDPEEEETKTKRCSGQSGGKTIGKRRGRPRKNVAV